MSVIVKGDSPFDAFIVSGIKGCHTEHIKFYNISFNCKTIEDADGRVFTRREERKNGKWIEVEDFYNRIRGRCSVCGWEAHMYEDDVVGMDYCPNCGARLENGEDV